MISKKNKKLSFFSCSLIEDYDIAKLNAQKCIDLD
jgi:hypothetical protein